MKITFSKQEITDILLREADVLVSNYHIGECELEIERDYNLPHEITIEATLLPYEEPKSNPYAEDITFTEEDLTELKDELEKFDPADGLPDDDSTPGDTFMHEGLK